MEKRRGRRDKRGEVESYMRERREREVTCRSCLQSSMISFDPLYVY